MRNAQKEHIYFSVSSGKRVARSLKGRLTSAKKESKTSASTCPRDNAGSAQKGNKRSARLPSLLPSDKSVSSSEPLASVESGFLISPSWPNPSITHKAGEQEPLLWESTQQKAFEEIKRVLTNTPTRTPRLNQIFLYVHGRTGIAAGILT